MTAPTPNWWKASTCYQIWPASYKDSNGDGIGDIPGIISTLPYLKDLGIETIWLSPMYASPQKDMGYDISDYEDIYPPYGTLADMDEMIEKCHSLGMKLILDLVVNHTSDQHAWFVESRKDKTNKYADWYIWRDPKMVDGQRHRQTTGEQPLVVVPGNTARSVTSTISISLSPSSLISTGRRKKLDRQYINLRSTFGWQKALMGSGSTLPICILRIPCTLMLR